MTRGLCLITGASRGIGAATAVRAAEAGWDVAVNYVSNHDAANAVVDAVTNQDRRAVAIQGDVSRESDVIRLFEQAEKQLGPIRALVNNAGTTGRITRVEDMTTAAMKKVLELNVLATMMCSREAVRRMSTRRGGAGGVIVNISSIAPRIGSANEFVHYAASKGAVDVWTWGLAREVAGEGIRVNAVAPGMIKTELHDAAGDPDRAERYAKTIPMGRSAEPEEVASAIIWMLSEEAGYCAGSILEVSGGR
ncbi:MAG: SDR family oxidoreductase [Pseudomonadota bacterium]|nr:SDR family oxidoreductase [Pseudomonadota bacterium]